MPAALPATRLYFSASPTFSVARVTTGRNRSASGARVFSAKKSVTEVSPPARIFLASFTVMDFTALVSSSCASGTAASAARFIADFQLIHLLAPAHGAQEPARIRQETRQGNSNFRVVQESTRLAEQADGRQRAPLERGFQS